MRGTVDAEDAILAPIFTFAAGASVGIANIDLFNYTLQDVVYSLSGTDITAGAVISALALIIAFATNEPDLNQLSPEYKGAVASTAFLVVAIPFMPVVNDFVTSSDAIALVAVAIESFGYLAVSYLG